VARSHGGLRSSDPFTDEQFSQYDRLLKDNNFHVTGGVSYSLPKVDLFASYVHYAGGTDTHVGHAVTAGVSFPFERSTRGERSGTGGNGIPPFPPFHPFAPCYRIHSAFTRSTSSFDSHSTLGMSSRLSSW
jgi:hypothetical protein